MNKLQQQAISFLKELIATPSFSGEEQNTALIIQNYLSKYQIPFKKKYNNVWAVNKHFCPSKPTILLNSHHDTVKPSADYTTDPFTPLEKDDKIFGLGSNDAGASLVGLWATFVYFFHQKLNFNLIFAATAEEENSGKNGVESILNELGNIYLGIVGEPTGMHLAITEKGLVVLDCEAKGKATHVAHSITEQNSLYTAMEDILKIKNYKFERKSQLLGETKACVTMINAGVSHNVIPEKTKFTVDVRTNELYTNQEIVDLFRKMLKSEVKARSTRLNPSKISLAHPIVKAAQQEGRNCYGSPTLSDQALMPFDTVKIGIGNSQRSHKADEYVEKKELQEGIQIYVNLLSRIISEKILIDDEKSKNLV